jgi:hypothetical protein
MPSRHIEVTPNWDRRCYFSNAELSTALGNSLRWLVKRLLIIVSAADR